MRWKKIIVATALIFAVLILAFYSFIEFYDFNKFKPLIVRMVKDATGRELTIRGDLAIKFGIRPTIVIEDVSLQNAAWSARPDLGRVKRLETQIAVWPLILGKFDFARLVLVEPEVIVEFNSTGISNFLFGTAGDDTEETKMQPPPLIFSDVLIEKGLFTYQDAESGFKLSATIDRMAANIPGFAESLQVDYKGTVNDIPLTVKGTVGPIWAWVEPGYSLPADLAATAAGTTARITGEIRDPIDFKGLAFDISARGTSVVQLTRLAGISGVPELGAFESKGKLSGSIDNLAVEKLDIQIGSEELAAISLTGELKDVFGLREMNLDFNARGQDSANLIKFGLPALPERGPFQISARISDSEKEVFTASDLSIVLGENEVNGQVILNMAGKVPFVTAGLASKNFRFGQMKLDLKITDPFEKAAIEKIDLKAGSPELAEVDLHGKVDDLKGLQGVDIKFKAAGEDLANLKQVIGQPPPLRGPFSAAGMVLIPLHKHLEIPDLKISIGKNEIAGSLKLDLTGDRPQLAAKFSTPKLDLPSVLLPELAKEGWAKGVGQVRPIKLNLKISGFSQEIAVKNVDLRAGSLDSADVRLTGSIANLAARRGIDLNFSVRGRNQEKLKEIIAQPYLFAPVPARGAYTMTGQISDLKANVYRVNNFKFKQVDAELKGFLDFNLAGPSPVYEVEMSGPKFSLKQLPVLTGSAFAELKKINDLGAIKLYSKVMLEDNYLSLQYLDLQAGKEQLALVDVRGSIKNLTEQKGIDLNFKIRGNEIANLEKISGWSLPLKGSYAISGRLSDPAAKKYKFSDLKLNLGQNNIAGRLNLNLTQKRTEFAAELSAPKFTLQPLNIPAIKPLAAVKDLGPLKLVANLTASGKKMILSNLDFRMGSEQLAVVMLSGKISDLAALNGFQLDFAIKGSDLANLKKMVGPQLPMKGPFDVSGQFVDPSPKIYKIPTLAAILGENDIKGSLELNITGKRPRVTADLSSQNIDLRPVLASADWHAPPMSQPDKSEKPHRKRDKIFPNEPLHLEFLKIADAGIKIRNKQLLLPKLAFDDLLIDLKLEDGNLEIKPFKFMIGGGKADVRFALRSQQKPAVMATHIDIDQLDTGSMLDKLGYERDVNGNLNALFSLDGSGDSVAALMAGLNGNIRITMNNGRADSKYLELLEKYLGSGILRMLNPFEEKREFTPVNCFVNKIEIKDGLADVKILLDTDRTSIFGAGDVNLKTEALDLGIKPSPKKGAMPANISFSLGGLSQPFRLGGTLAHPHLAIDPGRTAFVIGKLAGALALGPIGWAAFFVDVSLGKKDACAIAMESADQKGPTSDAKESSKETTVQNEKKKEKNSGGFFKRLFGK